MTSMTDAQGGGDGRVARESARVARELYEVHLRAAADALVSAIRVGVSDGAETFSLLLATAAANLGGMHALTALRPGSWKAHHVDQFLASTVGVDGEWLLRYRTAPIEIVECVEDTLVDLDIEWLYDESLDLIDQAEPDVYGEDAQLVEAAGERYARAEELISELRDRDFAAYREAFEARVQAAAGELRRTRHLPESVPVRVRWVDWTERGQVTRAQDAWGSVESEVWETARLQTPPPGFSEPLVDVHGPESPGDVLRRTGRMPHHRIPELARYTPASTATQQPTENCAGTREDAGGSEPR
jgi:hypothetical protein